MGRRHLRRCFAGSVLAFVAVATAGNAAIAESTLQGSQNTTDATSASGATSGSNTNSFHGGPAASGSSSASANQLGSNTKSASQSGSAKSGDSVAAAQVAGAVGDDVTVQNQNAANGTVIASTGEVNFTNELFPAGGVGPLAESEGSTSASQVGDNALAVQQVTDVASGDAVAGAQVTGIVGSGAHTVQNQNSVTDGVVLSSGGAVARNRVFDNAGPFAEGADPVMADQLGDNAVAITQDLTATTGDAVGAAQITGVVGGDATVQNQNNAASAVLASGTVAAVNVTVGTVSTIAGPFADGDNTQSAQVGDNTLAIDQSTSASTGDAVAGSQVFGGVGDAGTLELQEQNAAESTVFASGGIATQNEVIADLGPSGATNDNAMATQDGDNAIDVAQTAESATGDAVGASQVSGAVGYDDVTIQNENSNGSSVGASGGIVRGTLASPFAVNGAQVQAGPFGGGGVDSQASQIGDNALAAAQTADLATGDAVLGEQVTGVVGGTQIDVQQQNVSDEAVGASGSINLESQLSLVTSRLGPEVDTGEGAQASQIGDNSGDLSQAGIMATGDAVLGSQVTGIVADDAAEVAVQNQNESASAVGASGLTFAGTGLVGSATVGVGSFGSTTAQASQNGDNAVSVTQALTETSGDAVLGSQVTGLVAGDGADIDIQQQNTSIEAVGASGSVGNFTAVTSQPILGPDAVAAGAAAAQTGDNSVVVDQALVAGTGDAVLGSQVTGAVAGNAADVAVQNTNSGGETTGASGDLGVQISNNVSSRAGGRAVADADPASASQVGDNEIAITQSGSLSTGDAVGGAQVTGVVAGDGADVDVQQQNTGETIISSGDAGLLNVNVNGFDAGPIADGDGSAQATQNGDNSLAADQVADVATGDAVGGAQVTGVVAGTDSEIDVQQQQAACSDVCIVDSGDIGPLESVRGVRGLAVNLAGGGGAGPSAVGADASASQIGDDELAVDQVATLQTGDAVGGSQVTGVVAGDGSATTVQNQNAVAGDVIVGSGDIDIPGNVVTDVSIGPDVDAADVGQAEQIGDDSLVVTQDLSAATGDAVGGSQVTGLVGGDAQVQVSNAAPGGPIVDSGAIDTTNLGDGVVGPSVDAGDAFAQQDGDNGVTHEQDLGIETGDAVAGSQIGGAVS